MNTISYKDLKAWYLNEDAKAMAQSVFGGVQPSIYRTGFYSAPSWNWGYQIGIVAVISGDERNYYEVVTQFGSVAGARQLYLPTIEILNGKLV